jgi:hypothetical protein
MAHGEDTIRALVTAVLAFTDCEAAFGAADPRTQAAKERMRDAAATMIHEVQPEPALTVLDGGLAEGRRWLNLDAALANARPPAERPSPQREL